MQTVFYGKSQIHEMSADMLLKKSHDFVRISALNTFLSTHAPEKRLSLLSQIQKIWENAMSNSQENIDSLQTQLYSVGQTDLVDVYKHDLDIFPPLLRQQLFQGFYRDSYSLMVPPIVPSVEGKKGGTLLIKYLRNSSTTDKVRAVTQHTGVIKWTTISEILMGELMSYFSTGFAVPSNALIDMTKQVHINKDQCSQLDEEKFNFLTSNLRQLRKNTKAKNFLSQANVVMLSEFKEGSNLLDFIKGEWSLLSFELKNSLLEQMGEIAFFHFIFGNTDGLAKFSYHLNNPTSINAGNILINRTKDNLVHVISIDNTIDENLLSNKGNLRKKREQFIATFFSSQENQSQITKLCQFIVQSIENFLFADNNLSFRPFFAHFTEYGEEFLLEGLKNAQKTFVEKLRQDQCTQDLQAIQNRYDYGNSEATTFFEYLQDIFKLIPRTPYE